MPYSKSVKACTISTAACVFLISFVATTVAQTAPPSPWVLMKGEPPALSLEDTSFAGRRAENTALVHHNGSRNDWIRSGTLSVAEPNLLLLMSRLTDLKPVIKTVVGSLEELTEIKASQHSYRPTYYAMTTRFGELRGIMFDVNADGVRKYCVGFHKPAADEVLVKGYVCSIDPSHVEPKVVSCLIDKVRYAGQPASIPAASTVECSATTLDPKGTTISSSADRL